MRLKLIRLLTALLFFAVYTKNAQSQNFHFACSRDTLVAGCPANLCITLKGIIPDLHGLSSSYAVNPASSQTCFPVYSDPSIPGTWTTLQTDDIYSPTIPIGFDFPFYGTTYNNLKVSSNGYITFNTALTGFSHYGILNNGGGLSATSGTPQDLPSTLYAGAIIMGAYHDIDISVTTSPNRRIQYTTVGTAPHRRWILSFYKIPLFQCTSLIENTHQIILYESTGIVEVTMFSRENCGTWNQGRAMIGMQDASRTNAIMAPGRRASDTWGGLNMNETWRFVPTAGASLFKRVELYDMSGNLITTGTVAPLSAGLLEASFPNVCAPAGTSTQYVIRSVYEKFDDPTIEIFGTDTVAINRQIPLTANANQTAASCGVSDGTITVSGVSGGTPPYEYSLNGTTWQTSNTFTGLASGNYTVYIRDQGNTCNTTIPVTITLNGNIAASTSSTATSCPGMNNGTITINSAGGTGPYTFTLDGGTPVAGTIPHTFTGLAGGNHTVLVTDISTGCTSTLQTVLVTNNIGIVGNASSTATSCPGANNGSVLVSTFSGVAPFTFSLDGGAPQSGPSPYTFNNISAGPHTVLITDAAGCTLTLNFNVSAGAGITAGTSSTAATCSSSTDGSITVNALSGTGPYTYSLDGGPAQSGPNPYTFNNVTAGAHTITVTDAAGCVVTTNVNVAVGAGITGNTTSTQASCAVATNGTITANATSGTGPYTYSLDGGPALSGANPYTFINVPAGSHTVVITDNFGCSVTSNITVGTGAGVSGTGSQTATACPGVNNGTITADATSGTGPFTYSLDGGPAQSGANPYTFTGVSAGAHTVLITDNFGCTTTLNVVVDAGPALTANAAPNATTCAGATNGTITVTATSGTGPYTFVLNGGAPVTAPSPYTFTNVAAGNHNIVVTDASGCMTNNISTTVSSGPPVIPGSAMTSALCYGSATGTLTVNMPSHATAPFQFSLDGVTWQSSNVFTGLASGSYTIFFQEANGCSGSINQFVDQPLQLNATPTATAVRCNGQSDGIITVVVTGGVGPRQYSIDGGANWQSSNTFNVPAGTYTIDIRDGNNCTTSTNITVTEPPVLTASSSNTNASCNGGADGTITVTANGGNGSYTYSIDGTNFQSSNVFNVVAGNYTVTVRDNLGCTTTFPAVVAQTNNLTFTPLADETICEGTSVQLNFVSNGIQYSWSPATGLNDPNVANPIANPTTTTNYTVTSTLGNCSATDNITVFVNPAPIPNAGPDGYICYGQTYQLQGSGGVQYTWTPSTYLNDATISNPVSTPSKTITYTLSEVTDALGCKSLTTDQVIVDVTPPIKVTTTPFDTVVYSGDQFQINASSIANIYSWTPSFGLSNPNIANPVVTAGAIGSTVIYKVEASTAAGCKGEGFVKVRVYTGPELYVSTAFTPNNDGKNDRFTPFPVGVTSIKYFRVFNRWGQLVFSTNQLHDGWDGKLGGIDQPAGVYAWMAEGITKDNKVITKKGTVTLIR